MYGEDGKWYAVFGNGLNSPNGNPVLYVVDLDTGAVVRRITAEDGGDLVNGLTQIVLADSDGNGRTDAVYGGDFQGNVWKFDLSAANPATWGVGLAGQPLFVATDAGGNRQPITGKPAVARGPSGGVMVYIGTGRYLSDTDAVSGGTQALQTFYGVWDRGTGGLSRANLQAQTITSQFGAGANIGRTLSNNRVNYATQRGWYVDLKLPAVSPTGERFIGDPLIVGGSITFTTSEPSGDTQCAPGLKSFGYRLDRLSGAPVLDRMERPDGSKVCPTSGCGALQVSAQGAPVLGGTVVQPQRPCRRGIDAECPAIADPEVIAAACGSPDPSAANFNPNYDACVTAEAAGEGGTALRCTSQVNLGSGFGGEPQVCGRQSWRQVR
jgi:type IV pilus assembly protein PilY1